MNSDLVVKIWLGSIGEHGNDIVILLCGGDKDSQDKDIQQAKNYWQEYLSNDED